MKNVILTHNELQLNLFWAFTDGLKFKTLGLNLNLHGEVLERDYAWIVTEHPQIEGSAVQGKQIFQYRINKGDYQMNDIRIGVTVSYLRDQGEKFLSEFSDFMEGTGIDRLANKIKDLGSITQEQTWKG